VGRQVYKKKYLKKKQKIKKSASRQIEYQSKHIIPEQLI